ncbi:MAG: DUF3168 domain-containing protein [Novosphingobium sp. 28-62-57]|uniref:DUF3168 domain-containing protein n=1 Tax=unclassified Novosphingobium TaxID=2644732 RepID=UPI000BDD96A8|nr:MULTISPECIES: DUF3168 domain-containing protein [unclassified Novosphingobium]OYW48444.1 MAG: DUF3168 domain-containing protein [Novosphingobium sp. 12-62-10]OYZ09293.1 MAG: DUF3168 domain-containing protein [Novosphingobium sp. 28-62-57]OYZ98668.1 MAG: DUF3168 domain-containing protein [Novosphingobium sp. 17-62-8]
MEIPFRAVLIGWLASDAALTAGLNAVVEEAPLRTALPWLALTTSASTNWGTKTLAGREIRVALELNFRSDDPLGGAALVSAIEARVESLPSDQAAAGFRVASLNLLRARAEQRGEALRVVVLEYRARVMAA